MNFNQSSKRPLSWLKQHVAPKGRKTYKVPIGLFHGLRLDLDLQNEMQIYAGLWEYETHRYIRMAARTCRWFIDVGAGKGELCLYFLKHSYAERIFAFEPQAPELETLSTNLANNGERKNPRITIFNYFVGGAKLPNFIALDALDIALDRSGFIKIDVDGYEMDVLRSGERLISQGNVTLLVETHSSALEDECLAWLVDRKYVVRVVPNAWWRFAVPERRPIPHNRWLWAEKKV